ncbi:DUF7601 domain-containing protein [Lentilactobacillus buchneri]|uniref:DUF7601 domain-containing protein n=1 Tax=Lentilactobacillus buchneri TaxID=1581 RepID=UPI0021A71090|nr:adhesive domain-containing protein [Lentilactobacillus buchneri]
MKKRTSFWIQAIGVLTLVLGNFFTAGTALADVISTKEVVVDNAKLIDDKRALVTKSKVGDSANLAFDMTVGGLSQAGTVHFDYNADYFKVKKKQFKFSNGDTKVVVDIDGEESTISWTNAIDKTDLEVILPVKFNRTVNDRELDFVVDDEKIKLPTLTVLDEDEKVKQEETTDQPDGDLQDDDILKQALADEKASDEAQAAREAEEAKQAEAKKEAEVKTEDQAEPKKETEINENSSQADDIQQPKQSNSDKAEALLKEKREADQKKAEEKSRQAIEENRKAEEQAAVGTQNDPRTVKDNGESKESQTPQTPDVSDLKGAKEAVASDDSDAEEPTSNELTRQLPGNGVFGDEGKTDITDAIHAASNPQFFTSINFNYIDKDGNPQNQKVPSVLEQELQLPAILREHKNIEITYLWDIDSIKENTGIDIKDGDYYQFDLKGLKYEYGPSGSFDEYITYGGRTIGRFIMTRDAEDRDTQHAKIIFLPGDLEGVTNIDYKAKIKTEINANAEEISFGESTKGEYPIKVEEDLVSIQKDGVFHTSNGVTDLDMLEWTSTFKVQDGKEANKVTLRDKFGGGYATANDKVSYEFEVKGADGQTVSITKNHDDYDKLVATGPNFQFNAKGLGLERGIIEIKVKMITPVTNFNNRDFKNTIRATDVEIVGVKDPAKTLDVTATITRENGQVKKTAKMDKDGSIKYTVEFTVDPGQTNIVLKDTLNSKRFTFSENIDDYTLIPSVTGWMKGDPKIDGQTLTVEFADVIVPSENEGSKVYKFSYIIKPTADVTDKDYQSISNTVEVNGQKKGNHFGPQINSKNNVSLDWQKMMSSWSIHVNQINRQIDGSFKITEPIEGETLNFLDYKKFYNSFTDTDGLTEEVKKRISFSKHENDQTWDYTIIDGEAYWGKNKDNKAFSVKLSGNQIIITVENLPAGEKSFNIYLKDVPLDKEKILNANYAQLEKICNYAGLEYSGSDDASVKTCVNQGGLIRNNISKDGQLDKDFLNNGLINWTTRFNYRQYLGSNEHAALVTDGIDITDEVGPDVIKDATGKLTKRNLQDIQQRLQDTLQISLARINSDGRGVSDSQRLVDDQYEVRVDVDENHKVTFNLKLSEDAYNNIYLDHENADGESVLGKKVFELKYQSKVLNFKADEEATYEHLKTWTFNNKVTAGWKLNADDETRHTLEAKASVSYADGGHLLDKSGKLLEHNLELDEGDGQTRSVGAVKWNLAINGNGYELRSPVKLTDTLSGGHYHLKTNDDRYKLKIYEAKRSLVNKEVHYTKISDKALIEGHDYDVVYSDTLNTMTINVNNSYKVKTPLLVEYHTVTSKTVGTTYSNEIKLTIASKDFEDKEEIQSSAEVAGQYTTFAANVKKVDATTGAPLEGVKFQLQMKDLDSIWKNVGEPKATDKDGFASFDGLYDKPTYRIIETQGLENYDDRWVSKEFTIKDAQEETEDGNENTYCVTAKNHRTNALKIKKTVTNSLNTNKDDKFEFKVYVINDEGDVDTDFNDDFTYDIDGDESVVNFKEGVSTNLQEIKDGQVITIHGLPQDKTYRVIESANGSYSTTHSLDNLTTVEPDGNGGNETDTFQMMIGKNAPAGIVQFTNDVQTTHFGFSKTIQGPNANADKNKEFDFMLKVLDDDNQPDKSFNGTIEGIKHSGGDIPVKFKFTGGVAKEIIYTDGSTAPIKLKTGESYRNIQLPANVKVKVYEKQDTQYTEVHYKVGDGDENEAGNSDEDGWKATGSINATNTMLKFINRQVVNQFEFEKTVAGDMPEGVVDFKFKVKANDDATRNAIKGQKYKAVVKNSTTDRIINSGDITFDDEGAVTEIEYGVTGIKEITLKDNEKLVILGLPKDATKFTVTELSEGHYDTNTHVDGEEKKNDSKAADIELNRENFKNSIQFENISPDLVPFTLRKTVSGTVAAGDKDKAFEFVLTIKNPPANWGDAKTKEFKADNADGKITFTKDNDVYKSEIIKLKADQGITIYISKGLLLEAQETKTHGFEVSHKFGNHTEDGDTHELTTDKDMADLIFNNHSLKTGIEVKKTVKGETVGDEDFNKQFRFRVEGTSENGGRLDGTFTLRKYEVSGKYTDTPVSFNANNIIAFNLKHDQKAQLLGLPIGANIQVTETKASSEGYDPSYKVNENTEKSGNVAPEFVTEEGKLGTVIFTNTKFEAETAELKISKHLAGGGIIDADKNKTFQFVIEANASVDGEYDALVNGHDKVKVTFTDGKATVNMKADENILIYGLPSEHNTYTVTETNGSGFHTQYQLNGTRMEDGVKTKEFQLVDKDRVNVDFTNSKDTEKVASLKINKEIAGDGLTTSDHDRDFNFRIYSGVTGEFKATKVDQHGDSHEITVKFADGQSDVLTLKDSESLTVTGLPIDYTYAVGEEYVDGFAPTYQVNGAKVQEGMTNQTFKLVEDQKGTVEFTNTKNGEMELGILSVSKFVNELGDRARKFEFHIEATDGANNPLNGTFKTQVTTNGQVVEGSIQFNGGNGSFTLIHGQSIKFFIPLGAKYEVSEKDYSADGYVTTVTKRTAVVNSPTVTGTATKEDDSIVYHNDLEDDEGELPLPGEDGDDASSSTLDSNDTTGTSGKSGTLDSPMGIPSSGYTGKSALPQTGEDNNTLPMVIGMFMLVGLLGTATIYYAKRKQEK